MARPKLTSPALQGFVMVTTLLALAGLAAAGWAIGNRDADEAEAAFLPPIEQPAGDAGGELAAGQQVFIASGCGGCHELAAADATGTVGPSLDRLDPTEEQVAEIVENGRGAMPAFEDQLAPEQIDAVAAYVAASAAGGP